VIERGPVGPGNVGGGVVQDDFHWPQSYSAPAIKPDSGL